MSLAYFPFYPSDYLSSATVQCMSLEQQGAYVRLLCYMWKTPDCTLPNDVEVLIRLIGDSERDLVGDLVQMSMKVSDDGKTFTNERLKKEFDKAHETYRKQVEGGKERAKSMWAKDNPQDRSPIRIPTQQPDRLPTPNQNQNQNQKETTLPGINPGGDVPKKRKVAVDNELPEVIKFFVDNYEQSQSVPYPFSKKDAALLKRLNKVYGKERLMDMMDVFFQNNDEFKDKAGHTVGVFSTQAVKIAEYLKRTA